MLCSTEGSFFLHFPTLRRLLSLLRAERYSEVYCFFFCPFVSINFNFKAFWIQWNAKRENFFRSRVRKYLRLHLLEQWGSFCNRNRHHKVPNSLFARLYVKRLIFIMNYIYVCVCVCPLWKYKGRWLNFSSGDTEMPKLFSWVLNQP